MFYQLPVWFDEMIQLLYDRRDDAYHERIGSQILYWLDDLDAIPLDKGNLGVEGFLFAGARPIADYRELVARFPLVLWLFSSIATIPSWRQVFLSLLSEIGER